MTTPPGTTPEEDLVGTVADMGGRVWIKRDPEWWFSVGSFANGQAPNASLRDRKVTGAVHGTPAAHAVPALTEQQNKLTGSDLPTQLVTAAAAAVRDAHEVDVGIPASQRPLLSAPDWEPEARAAVVATLRTVVDRSQWGDALAIPVSTLITLAVRIEQGDGK